MSESHAQNRPVISVAIRPRTNDDRENLQRVLHDLTQEDPTMRIETEPTGGEIIVSGMGELHLEIICDRILREYKIQVDVGESRIIYLETIRKGAEAEGKYLRQTGGRGQYAHVKVRLEPQEPGSGYQFVNEVTEAQFHRNSWSPSISAFKRPWRLAF